MIKCTALFNLGTVPADPAAATARIGGWSESWYFDGTPEAARTNFERLCAFRAGLMPTTAAIIGQRYQVIGGGSATASRRFPGAAGIATDVPQMGLLCTFPGQGVANIRRLTLRGFPDGWVSGGELLPNFDFNAAFTLFALAVTSNAFRFRGRDLAAPSARIAGIAARVLTLTDPLVFIVGDYLQLRDVRTTTGRSVSGRYQVEATTGPTNATLRGFPATSTVELNGFANKYTIIYPLMQPRPAISFSRIVVKKVGRPFGGYRGRSSKRNR